MRVNVSGMYKYFSIILCIALAGCSLARRQPEHPKATIPSGPAVPPPPADVLAIPDAVPRAEPRGARGNPPSYVVFGKRYYGVGCSVGGEVAGTASCHGAGFHAAAPSLGEPYDKYGVTAAHKTLPIPGHAQATHLPNGAKGVVRSNYRGPVVGDRIIALPYAASAKLDMA